VTPPAAGDGATPDTDLAQRLRRWAERDDLIGACAERDQLRDQVAALQAQLRSSDEAVARQAQRIDQLTVELARTTSSASISGRLRAAAGGVARRVVRIGRRIERRWQ
jgi:multidrug efflux pump subunit AcrA (membrane-fusion protein)